MNETEIAFFRLFIDIHLRPFVSFWRSLWVSIDNSYIHGSNLGSSSVEDSNESLTFDDVNIEIDFDVKLIM